MARTSDNESCASFAKGYLKECKDCIDCSKTAKARAKKCKNLTNKLVRESCSTDEEIEKYLKENK